MPKAKWSGTFGELMKQTAKVGDPDELARLRYITALRSDAPNQWYSDHLSESQQMVGPIYVAIKVLMDQAAAAECKIYRWDEDARMGGDQDAKEPIRRNHDLARLFLYPNNHESGGYLRARRVQQLSLTGTALCWRVDDGMETPRELWSVPTGTYQPVPISAKYPDGAYRVMPWFPGPLAMVPGAWNQGGVVVDAEQMVAVRHPHPLVQQEGLSPPTACATEMDTVKAISRSRYSISRQAGNPSAVIEADAAMTSTNWDSAVGQRMQKELFQLVGGPDRAGKIAVLAPGLTLKPYEVKKELGWSDDWDQLVGFVMSVFGVTRSMAFMNEDASYALLYAALKQFNLFTLSPLLQLLADADNMQLVWPFFGEDYCVEYVPRKVDDHTITEAELANDLKCGSRTVNEIRALRNLQAMPWGEERASASFKSPEQMQAEADAKPPPAPAANGRPGAEGKPPADEVERARPRNDQGAGSLPPRIGPARIGGFNQTIPGRNGKAFFNGRSHGKAWSNGIATVVAEEGRDAPPFQIVVNNHLPPMPAMTPASVVVQAPPAAQVSVQNLVNPTPVDVHVSNAVNPTPIRNEVNVAPAPVTVQTVPAPRVVNRINPTPVTVQNTVETGPVYVDVGPTPVNIENRVEVQPAPPRRGKIERDRNGNTTGFVTEDA